MGEIKRRRAIRLTDYDYSQPSAYFVTICTHRHACLFGRIEEYEMQLYRAGLVVADCWRKIPEHFPTVSLDEWIVMPNQHSRHLRIDDGGKGEACLAPTKDCDHRHHRRIIQISRRQAHK